MDIKFLLELQEFRERTGGIFDAFFEGVSDFVIGSWVFLIIALVYWCIDKKSGTMIMMNVGVGNIVMQFFKNLFCVYRPWVREPRIKPVGDSILTATGYSFPSGHTQVATSEFGSFALWQKKRKWFIVLCIAVIAFVAFSRTYLGVHTPQDVIVGVALTSLVIWLDCKLLKWVDGGDKRDVLVFVTAMVLCAIYLLFITYKSYPVEYTADGMLLADPIEMIAEGYSAASCAIGFFVGWFIERRFINFEPPKGLKNKIICFLIGAVLLLLIKNHICDALSEYIAELGNLGLYISRLIKYFILFVFVMIIYPVFINIAFKKARN